MLYFGLENKEEDEFSFSGKGEEKRAEKDSKQSLPGEKEHSNSSQEKDYAENVAKYYQKYRADGGRRGCRIFEVDPEKVILWKSADGPGNKNKAEDKGKYGTHGEPSQVRL